MSKFEPQLVTTGHFSNDLLNENFTELEEVIETLLSRDGTSPNTMEANLDMNSNRIINLPNALSASEPVTYGQLLSLADVSAFTGTVTEQIIATADQTVFNLSVISYTPGVDNLAVYRNGLRVTNYVETDADTVTFSTEANEGDEYLFVVNERAVSSDSVNSSSVLYTNPSTSETTSLYTYLNSRHISSVKDFGAVCNGTSDDTDSIQDAVVAREVNFLPKTSTVINGSVNVGYDTTIQGYSDNFYGSIIRTPGDTDTFVVKTYPTSDPTTTSTRNIFRDLKFVGHTGAVSDPNNFFIKIPGPGYMHQFEDVVFGDASYGQNKSGISLTGGSIYDFDRIRATNMPNSSGSTTHRAIYADSAADISISNSQFERGANLEFTGCYGVHLDSVHGESISINVEDSQGVSIDNLMTIDCGINVDERSIVSFHNYQQLNTELRAHPASVSFSGNSRLAEGPRVGVVFNPVSEESPAKLQWKGTAYNTTNPFALPAAQTNYLTLARLYKTTASTTDQTSSVKWVDNGTGSTLVDFGSITIPGHVGYVLNNNQTQYAQKSWSCATVVSSSASGQYPALDTSFGADIWASPCLNSNPNFESNVDGWATNPTNGLATRQNCTVTHDAGNQRMVITPSAAGGFSVTQWCNLPPNTEGKNLILCIQGNWDDNLQLVVSNSSAHNGADTARSFAISYTTEDGKKIAWVLSKCFNTSTPTVGISIGAYSNTGTPVYIDWAAMAAI